MSAKLKVMNNIRLTSWQGQMEADKVRATALIAVGHEEDGAPGVTRIYGITGVTTERAIKLLQGCINGLKTGRLTVD